LGVTHFDTDEYYWPTDPPFRVKRNVPEHLPLLEAALGKSDDWVLSGSNGRTGIRQIVQEILLLPRFSTV
jgi:hypothetical protein